LIERGYDVVPVYPRETEILGRTVYRAVAEIPGHVDLVDVFRRSEDLPAVVNDALAARAGGLWFQLSCVDHPSAHRASGAGLTVVMDRCVMVEHARLLGRGWKRPS
jgi:predicted CoA-binding protein